MATTTTPRTPWLLILGVLLAVVAAALITFTDLAWRGLIGWPLLLVALLLVVTGGIRRGQQREGHPPSLRPSKRPALRGVAPPHRTRA